jgi:hypothetical protein
VAKGQAAVLYDGDAVLARATISGPRPHLTKFRIAASTPRYRDNATGEWKDGDTLFLTSGVGKEAVVRCDHGAVSAQAF